MTSREANTGVVEASVCRFCECWGREGTDEAADGDVISGRKWKNKTNNQHWNGNFRSDKTPSHMIDQHPMKFTAYTELKEQLGMTWVKLGGFFEQTTVIAFFEKRSTVVGHKHVFASDMGIVEFSMKEFVIPNFNVRGDD